MARRQIKSQGRSGAQPIRQRSHRRRHRQSQRQGQRPPRHRNPAFMHRWGLVTALAATFGLIVELVTRPLTILLRAHHWRHAKPGALWNWIAVRCPSAQRSQLVHDTMAIASLTRNNSTFLGARLAAGGPRCRLSEPATRRPRPQIHQRRRLPHPQSYQQWLRNALDRQPYHLLTIMYEHCWVSASTWASAESVSALPGTHGSCSGTMVIRPTSEVPATCPGDRRTYRTVSSNME